MYRKPRRATFRARLRRDLKKAITQNQIEQRIASGSIERGVRARLQEQKPGATADEVEAGVKKILAAGGTKTHADGPAPKGIPTDVLKARRAARKRTVKAMRSRRR